MAGRIVTGFLRCLRIFGIAFVSCNLSTSQRGTVRPKTRITSPSDLRAEDGRMFFMVRCVLSLAPTPWTLRRLEGGYPGSDQTDGCAFVVDFATGPSVVLTIVEGVIGKSVCCALAGPYVHCCTGSLVCTKCWDRTRRCWSPSTTEYEAYRGCQAWRVFGAKFVALLLGCQRLCTSVPASRSSCTSHTSAFLSSEVSKNRFVNEWASWLLRQTSDHTWHSISDYAPVDRCDVQQLLLFFPKLAGPW